MDGAALVARPAARCDQAWRAAGVGLAADTPRGYIGSIMRMEGPSMDTEPHTAPVDVDHAGTAHDSHVHPVNWAMAAQATLHCLTGCAIGEVLGMVIGTSIGLHNAGTVVLSIALAFVFGYALTVRGLLRAGLPFRRAARVALAADTVSIAVMELVDNAVVVAVPGAMDAGITTVLFWTALAVALVIAFVVTTPVNRWLMGKGKGHAVVHAYH